LIHKRRNWAGFFYTTATLGITNYFELFVAVAVAVAVVAASVAVVTCGVKRRSNLILKYNSVKLSAR